MHPMTSSLWKQCHLVVGHTVIPTLSKFEINRTDGSWDINTFVPPVSPNLTIIRLPWDMASELTPQQLITQSAQATADTSTSALTARMASIHDWDSQDAFHSFSIFHHTLENWLLLNCNLPDSEDHLRYVFAALGTKSLEMHAQWMPTSSKEEQKATKAKASAFLNQIQQGMTHDVNTHVCLGELRDSSQSGRGPPRSHCTHQDTDGPLWNDQWWASQAWTVLPYCVCILPWGKANWKTYGQAIQDTLQWAGWHYCEPICHPTCQGTSPPQLQTCGHNLPGQKAEGPHQPQQPWSHTTWTLQGLSQLHTTAPSQQSKLPGMWFPLFQMWQDGTLGTKMPWWQATPTKECTSTWVMAEEVQMPT